MTLSDYIMYAVGMPARIICRDGFSLSVQASRFHYCSPRSDQGPWTAFEIGFPSEAEPLLLEFAENPDAPTATVYGWVPNAVVMAVIAKHGGAEALTDCRDQLK